MTAYTDDDVPMWTRCGDTIHVDPGCVATRRAKRLVRWPYANGRTIEQIRLTIDGAAPWLRKCRRCWPAEAVDE